MNNEKFTPGEWESVGNLIMAKRKGYSFCIGSVLGGGVNNIDDDTAEANARLFAASKEMYEALKELVYEINNFDIPDRLDEYVEAGMGKDFSVFVTKAKAALAKANPQPQTAAI